MVTTPGTVGRDETVVEFKTLKQGVNGFLS
jgi:hypothetical protein